MTQLTDPITGEELDCYCVETDLVFMTSNKEVYRCNNDKAIAVIQRDKLVNKDEAIRLLSNSDIDNPIICSGCEFWVE